MKKALILIALLININNLYSQGFYRLAHQIDSLYPNDTTEDGPKAFVERTERRWYGQFNKDGKFRTAAQNLYSFSQGYKQFRVQTSGCGSFTPEWKKVGPVLNSLNSDILDASNPTGGGQINRLTFHPQYNGTTNQIIYGLSAFGGIWKTIDNGESWDRLNTDAGIPFSSVGVLVIDPINPQRMYVTTGHPSGSIPYTNISSTDDYPMFTLGIYASDDGGLSWSAINHGLESSNLFLSASIFNLQIDPTNHANLIFTSTDGVFICKNADQALGLITWSKDSDFPFTDNEIIGLTYNPTTYEWYISGNDIYRCANPFSTTHIWQSATGSSTGLDLTGGLYQGGDPIQRITLINSLLPSYNNEIYFMLYTSSGTVSIGKKTASGWQIFDDLSLWKVEDKMAFVKSPNSNDFFIGSLTYGYYNSTTHDITATYGNGINGANPASGNHHADIHGLYIHPSQPNKLWLVGDGGVSVNDIIPNSSNSLGFTYKNTGIQSQLLWDFDDSEKDENYYLAALQDNGTQYTGGVFGSQWKSAYFGGDGFESDILDTDPTQAFATGNSHVGILFNYTNPANSLGSPFSAPTHRSSLFSDPHNPLEKVFVGDWNLIKTKNNGTLWFSTANYGTSQITLNYNGLSFCANPNVCNCKPPMFEVAHQNYCGTSAPAYGISPFQGGSSTSCVASGSPIPSLVFKSTDGYDDWFGQNYFGNINSITNALYDKAKLDGAISAIDFPVLSGVACHPSNGNKVWVCSSGLLDKFKIWKSTDGGTSWANADPYQKFAKIPVFEIVALDDVAETVFAGTLDGVFYTDNTMGGSWCHYGATPSVAVFNLKINYSKRTLLVGTYGCGAYEVTLPYSSSSDININANTTWTTPQHFPINNVIVKTGKTLTIQNTTCYFGPLSRIYVEAGAKLVVSNATLTSESCTNYAWEGIELQGDYTQKQVLSGAYYSKHGWCVLNTNSKIKNARVGIKNYATVNGDGKTIDYTKLGGGIIQSTSAQFINCKTGIKFIDYINKNALNQPINDKSTITTTQFLTDATTALKYFSPTTHISMNNTRGITITSNTFKNNTPTSYLIKQRGYGITSYDATYDVATPCTQTDINGNCITYGTPNTFENLYYAIDAGASLTSVTVKINKATFTNNHKSITLHGLNLPQATNNTISLGVSFSENSGVGTGTIIYPTAGIYLDGCDAYTVRTNTFSNGANPIEALSYGIVNSSSDANPNELKQNKFSNLAVGIQPQDNNNGLQLKCNKFTATSLNKADIKLFGTIAPDQGFCSTNDPTTLPGNEFSHTCGTYAQDLSGLSNNGAVNYNARTTVSTEIPQSGCYNTSYYNVLPCIGAGAGEICPVTTGGGSFKLANPLVTDVNNGKQNVKNLENLLETGNSKQVITAVNSGNASQMSSVLNQASPYLSDNVLLALLNYAPAYNENDIKPILLANSPLSNQVYAVVQNKGFSSSVMTLITNAQTGTSQRTYTQRNLAYEKSALVISYNKLLSSVLNDFEDDNRYQEILKYIDYTIKPSDRALKASLLIEQGNYTAADAELDSLPESNNDLKTHLKNVIAIHQNQNKKEAYNGNVKTFFDNQRAKRPLPMAVKAQALYNSLYEKAYGEVIYLDNTQVSRLKNEQEQIKEKVMQDNLVKVFPNPANNELFIVLNAEELQGDAIVTIIDVNGRLVRKENYAVNDEPHKIELNELTDGIYFYNIIVKEKCIKSSKLVIIK